MNQLLLIAILWVAPLQACTSTADADEENIDRHDLGVFPIGSVLSASDARAFRITDCTERPDSLADCSGIDHAGRRYAIFDSAVSVVSADSKEASDAVALPFGLNFGESIKTAVGKIEEELSIAMDVSLTINGGAEYSTDFAVMSGAGVPYSIVLVADSGGRLTKYIERTDY